MAIYKCKMCGGDLEIAINESVAECEYCGARQTVPANLDENLQGVYNRANNLRFKCEFDNAESLYEKIISKDTRQAEAYWGLVLCKYGIEYVEDPNTFQRVPTCHRTLIESVLADDNYKKALENADFLQKSVYEREAAEIDRLQKEILELSRKEEPYDVFICYKETDETGIRTPDSVIANDIYHQLIQEGFKVFYAPITLEGKLGQAYEPCIFAALNSAKVMLALGTKPQYFNAVWVKNEWSRFLKIIQNDRSKILIPCYKDMDPYDLPEEFSHLQAQDMGKIGFITDILRGIKKLFGRDEVKQVKTETTNTNTTASNVAPLLERAFIFLEDGEWEKADGYCEKVLDIEPKHAQAYLGKLLADLKCKNKEDLKNLKSVFNSNKNYKKIIQFGDEKLKEEIEEINQKTNKNIEENINNKKSKLRQQQEFIKDVPNIITTLPKGIIGLKTDGTVMTTNTNEDGQCDVEDWSDIVQITATGSHTVGLKSNGTVVATGNNEDGQCDVENWSDTVQIISGNDYTVGIKSDGTVMATGNNEDGQCDVEDWTDIVQVAAGEGYTVGLKSDGTVVATGNNEDDQCNVDNWTDIVQITVGDRVTVGLRTDGEVMITGTNDDDQYGVRFWEDIVKIATGEHHTVGIKSDGTVVAEGDDRFDECYVEDWTDIVQIAVGIFHTVGIKSDGTVVATGYNEDGQCDVQDWKLFNNILTVNREIQERIEKRKPILEVEKEAEKTRIKAEKEAKEARLKAKKEDEMAKLKAKAEEKARKEAQIAEWKSKGLCQYCGGTLKKTLFSNKCISCGKPKDY